MNIFMRKLNLYVEAFPRARAVRLLQVEEEESVVFSNIEVRVKRAGPSGLGDLEVTEYIARIYTQRAVRERGRRICPPWTTTEARFMPD